MGGLGRGEAGEATQPPPPAARSPALHLYCLGLSPPAATVITKPFSLKETPADFATVSFYKVQTGLHVPSAGCAAAGSQQVLPAASTVWGRLCQTHRPAASLPSLLLPRR